MKLYERFQPMEEDRISKKVGTENPFRVPDGYFEKLTAEVMDRLPELEDSVYTKKEVRLWDKVKPWIYMAAMFVGAALIIRIGSTGHTNRTDQLATDDTDTEIEYINMAVSSSMLDDYSLYVYLTDSDAE